MSKKQIALDLLCQNNAIISTQVLNECSSILRKKFHFNYLQVSELINHYLDIVKVVNFDVHTIQQAWLIGNKYSFSYYDSLIAATAFEYNCKILYSEDMQHNQLINNSIKILNPFL